MATTTRVVATMAAVSSVSIVSLIAYDHHTCHPMRKMKGYDAQGAFIRLHNVVARNLLNLLPTRTYSLHELKAYNGETKPQTYFASDGSVYDVSGSEMFDSAYSLWKGKDASFCLAKMSMVQRNINRTDWESLTVQDIDSLHSWTRYFDQKYLIKGRVKEFPDEGL